MLLRQRETCLASAGRRDWFHSTTTPHVNIPACCVWCGLCWQVFGPYAAQVLASCCEQTMADCLQALDKQLETLHDILWTVLQQVTATKDARGCLPAVTAALSNMDPQAAVLNVSKTLGEASWGGARGGSCRDAAYLQEFRACDWRQAHSACMKFGTFPDHPLQRHEPLVQVCSMHACFLASPHLLIQPPPCSWPAPSPSPVCLLSCVLHSRALLGLPPAACRRAAGCHAAGVAPHGPPADSRGQHRGWCAV